MKQPAYAISPVMLVCLAIVMIGGVAAFAYHAGQGSSTVAVATASPAATASVTASVSPTAQSTPTPTSTPQNATSLVADPKNGLMNIYTNQTLGLSLDIPRQVDESSCVPSPGHPGYYKASDIERPMTTFVDGDALYVATSAYVVATMPSSSTNDTAYSSCQPNVPTTLAGLKNTMAGDGHTLGLQEDNNYIKIIVGSPTDNAGLVSFINERFGPGCGLGSTSSSGIGDLLSVKATGNYADVSGVCNLGVPIILYSPSKHKAVEWEHSNGVSIFSYKGTNLDDAMESSITFL